MKKIMLVLVFNILVCSRYNVGDVMGMNHQNQNLNYAMVHQIILMEI